MGKGVFVFPSDGGRALRALAFRAIRRGAQSRFPRLRSGLAALPMPALGFGALSDGPPRADRQQTVVRPAVSD